MADTSNVGRGRQKKPTVLQEAIRSKGEIKRRVTPQKTESSFRTTESSRGRRGLKVIIPTLSNYVKSFAERSIAA